MTAEPKRNAYTDIKECLLAHYGDDEGKLPIELQSPLDSFVYAAPEMKLLILASRFVPALNIRLENDGIMSMHKDSDDRMWADRMFAVLDGVFAQEVAT